MRLSTVASRELQLHLLNWWQRSLLQFIEAVRGNRISTPFSYSEPLTESVLWATLSTLASENDPDWDGPNLQITNVREANAFVRRTYRKMEGRNLGAVKPSLWVAVVHRRWVRYGFNRLFETTSFRRLKPSYISISLPRAARCVTNLFRVLPCLPKLRFIAHLLIDERSFRRALSASRFGMNHLGVRSEARPRIDGAQAQRSFSSFSRGLSSSIVLTSNPTPSGSRGNSPIATHRQHTVVSIFLAMPM